MWKILPFWRRLTPFSSRNSISLFCAQLFERYVNPWSVFRILESSAPFFFEAYGCVQLPPLTAKRALTTYLRVPYFRTRFSFSITSSSMILRTTVLEIQPGFDQSPLLHFDRYMLRPFIEELALDIAPAIAATFRVPAFWKFGGISAVASVSSSKFFPAR